MLSDKRKEKKKKRKKNRNGIKLDYEVVTNTQTGSGLGKMVARGFISNGAASVTLVDMSRCFLDEAVSELETLKKEVSSTCHISTSV